MKPCRWLCVLMLLTAGSGALAETLSYGRFEKLSLYRPQGDAKQLVLFFSGEPGWTADLEQMAQSLSRQGALVAGIDTPALFRNLERDGADCVSPEGDLENLSHFLQAYSRSSTYRPPILLGHASGATFVYAMLAQAPAGTFSGGMSLGFCPTLALAKPLCRAERSRVADDKQTAELQPVPKLGVPWLAMQGMTGAACLEPANRFIAKVEDAESIVVPGDNYGEGDFHTWEPQFTASFQRLAAQALPALPSVSAAKLQDLPIIEVKARGDGDTLAVLISGDGGWAGIDKELAAALSSQGVPVVGLDSLRYFWSERTPQSTAADVDRIVRHYLAAWKKQSVLLIGYSQGADVMPFVVNRLPAATRDHLSGVALLALSQTAVFEFHLQNWLGRDTGAVPVEPELVKMRGVRTLCIYGEADPDSLCAMSAAKGLQVIKLSGGHHFDGDYPRLAALILARMH